MTNRGLNRDCICIRVHVKKYFPKAGRAVLISILINNISMRPINRALCYLHAPTLSSGKDGSSTVNICGFSLNESVVSIWYSVYCSNCLVHVRKILHYVKYMFKFISTALDKVWHLNLLAYVEMWLVWVFSLLLLSCVFTNPLRVYYISINDKVNHILY